MKNLALASLLTAAAMFAQSTPAAAPADTSKPATSTKVKKHKRHKKDAAATSTTSNSAATPAPKK